MKKKQLPKPFKVGDRVIEKWEEYQPYDDYNRRGKIVSVTVGVVPETNGVVLAEGEVAVTWDEAWMRSSDLQSTVAISADDLLHEKDGDKQLSVLDKEFRKLEKSVEVKMKEAGRLIKQANKIAIKAGMESLIDMNAAGPLLAAMDSCGWSTSSLSC